MSQENIVKALTRDLKAEPKLIGSFELKDKTLYVSDPSYGHRQYEILEDLISKDPAAGEPLFKRVENMKQGKYNVYAFYNPTRYGDAVVSLLIIHEEIPKDAPNLFFFEFYGAIPVDSGVVSVCPERLFEGWKTIPAKDAGFQEECSTISSNIDSVGVCERAPLVAVHSGDGTYSVSTGVSEKEGTFAVLVEFLSDYWSY